ncbi:twin-arginine translocation signal domain-containing protein [Haemophilus pittmaniae]|nr:twin-arginine translocation signal domain-containing protein [Haemophilus pittmaniae]
METPEVKNKEVAVILAERRDFLKLCAVGAKITN